MGIVFLSNRTLEMDKLTGSEGFGLGYGVFETMAMNGMEPVALNRHLNRLVGSCEKIGLEPPNQEEIESFLNHWIMREKLSDMDAIKIVAFKLGRDTGIHFLNRKNPYRLNETRSFRLCAANGIRDEDSPLVNIKSTSYLGNLMERRIAMDNGFDECYFMNKKGYLCEGSFTNLFLIIKDEIVTPSLTCGLLPGISRQRILDATDKIRVSDCITHEDIVNATGVAVTNALMGVLPVGEMDQIRFSNSEALSNELSQLLRGSFK